MKYSLYGSSNEKMDPSSDANIYVSMTSKISPIHKWKFTVEPI